MPDAALRFIDFAVVWRKLKLKQITTKGIKRTVRHKNTKTTELLRFRRSTVMLLVVTRTLTGYLTLDQTLISVISFAGSNFPK